MSTRNARGRRGALEGIDATVADGLSHLGLTTYEIRVYSAILLHPQSRVPEIARESRVPQPKVYSTVRRLLERGLLETHLGPVNEYSALPPEQAFENLLEQSRQRQDESQRAITALQERHREAREGLSQREGRVKLFQSRPAAARAFRELVQRARREALIVVRFPLITADYFDGIQELLRAGGTAQLLCEIAGEPTEQHRDFAELAREHGSELRQLDEVPSRMAVFDERILALPMNDPVPEQGDGFMMLEVRNADLSRSFRKIFRMLWSQGREL